MAGRLSCCLNLPLPNLNSSSSKKTSQPLWRRSEEEVGPRKIKCSVIGVAACLVISAIELGHAEGTTVVAAEAHGARPSVVEAPVTLEKDKNVRLPRWSDKRMCPPWRVNELETIVPENLPRPSSRRSWESVGIGVGDAPPVRVVVKRAKKADCFSM